MLFNTFHADRKYLVSKFRSLILPHHPQGQSPVQRRQTAKIKFPISLGAAMSAAVASGVYQNLTEAAKEMTRIQTLIEPQEKYRRVYDEKYSQYK